MELSLQMLPLIALAGLAAGFINVVAGGGSLITVPVMIFLGMPSAMANGTNRIAQLSQNSMAAWRFRARGIFPLRAGLLLGLAAALGSVIGSLVAVEIAEPLFNRILSAVMVLVLILTFSRRRAAGSTDEIRNWPLLLPTFFLIGIYGGFIQAGVGFLIMGAFSRISSASLVLTNAVKVLVVLVYTIPAVVVFAVNGQIAWAAGAVLACGQAGGAWLGAHFTVSGGERWIRVVLATAVLGMAIRLFFFT
ncbi:sulfite exporter TauE/SafE family protein [Spirochaeta africana]|uniref:Probable membrane transporter protein n=1 Tax=Spirochaeta africana (strain ATCC 700263 / DSM 8902 / Z-7692) TaxID=889378 RepID=H9UMG6_SPIAZ|nr:sulfite exporter TauE/SafE family protein [Spirochaeta africana]AFG38709.1 putative permease [Spirochaeta africana DSM 8902]